MTIIKFDNLPALKNELKNKKVVLCTGTFDLVHAGHVLFFEDCKKYGEKLVVVVAGDKIIKKHKGEKRPILNENVRIKMIDSLKPVDYCALDDFTHDHSDKLSAVEIALKTFRPDVYIINRDAFNIPYRKSLCEKYDTELIILERTCPEKFDNISTTSIIDKVRALIIHGKN